MKELQEFVNNYGLGISKAELISKAYYKLSANHDDIYTINDLYIHIDGSDYQVIKSKKENRWIVKEF